MGGLKKYMPITYWTCLVGSLALIGFRGRRDSFSKDALSMRCTVRIGQAGLRLFSA